MRVTQTKLAGLLVIEPNVFEDKRGFFFETFHESKYQDYGLKKPFVQDNISNSRKGVVRGLHYQLQRPQAKLISVFRGAVFDVVLDIRLGSPSFGEWFGIELSAENHLQLFIPEGFAHGFSVLSDEVDFFYKCSDYYHPPSEYGVLWNDVDLGIDWKVPQAILSPKDMQYQTLKDIPQAHLPKYEGAA